MPFVILNEVKHLRRISRYKFFIALHSIQNDKCNSLLPVLFGVTLRVLEIGGVARNKALLYAHIHLPHERNGIIS